MTTPLLTWFQQHQRRLPWRETRDPYHIWVSEVMLQQTQVATAIPYYREFLRRFPDVGALSRAPGQNVLKAWEGLGYYARARNLHRAAKIVMETHQGQVPNHYEAFRALPGVGDYIAAAVLSIAFDLPLAAVDGNVKRVLSRLCAIAAPVNASAAHPVFRQAAEALLVREAPGAHNQAMMELGAVVCTPKAPDCNACPLFSACQARSRQLIDEYPQRLPKKPIPRYQDATVIIEKHGKILIVQRPEEGLLGGLWEFPTLRLEFGVHPTVTLAEAIGRNLGLVIRVNAELGCVKHVYTHFKLALTAYRAEYISGRVKRRGSAAHRWITPAAKDLFPFSQAYRKIFPWL